MATSTDGNADIYMNKVRLEEVSNFKYLGAAFSKGRSETDVHIRIATAPLARLTGSGAAMISGLRRSTVQVLRSTDPALRMSNINCLWTASA